MQISWKKLEGLGFFLLAVAADELPKLAQVQPGWTWIGPVSAGVVATVAWLRMSPKGAAELNAANEQLLSAHIRLGENIAASDVSKKLVQ